MGKSVQDAMTSNPCTIDAGKPVAYAAKMMKQENVGIAPIVEGDRLVGTLTDRDIVVRVVAERQEREAVREAQGKRDVEGACRADLELARRVEPRREEVRLGLVPEQFEPGRDDSPEEGRRPQGRQGKRPEELAVDSAP